MIMFRNSTDTKAADKSEKESLLVKHGNGTITEAITYANPSDRDAFRAGAEWVRNAIKNGEYVVAETENGEFGIDLPNS